MYQLHYVSQMHILTVLHYDAVQDLEIVYISRLSKI